MITKSLIDDLLNSNEPSIVWKIRVNVLDENPNSRAIKQLQTKIQKSPRVKKLLSKQTSDGQLLSKKNVYDKWQGAHWILATLADIGYPKGDKKLFPVRDQILDYWLGPDFYEEYEVNKKSDVKSKKGVPLICGRYRRCASQHGNALYSIYRLGIENKRCDQLVERLLHWQWPDGGWNCDKRPEAFHSSFMETLLPMLGLWIYSNETKDRKSQIAYKKAAQIFLKRDLYKSQKDKKVINDDFIKLHYPLYWHYDILGALKAMAQMGIVKDKRCSDALDLLCSKQLESGGWALERKYYKVSDLFQSNADYVDWGGVNKKKINEWVTSDALYVLRQAGRIS